MILTLGNDSVVPAALEVICLVDTIGDIRSLNCVLHEQQVDWHHTFHDDLEYTINPCNNRIRMSLQVLEVFWQLLDHDVEFFLEHGLDDELTVVREEEETARLTLRFTSFKHCLIVFLGSQRKLNLFVTNTIKLSDLLEFSIGEVGDLNFLIDDGFSIILNRDGRSSLGSFGDLSSFAGLLFLGSQFLMTIELLHAVCNEFVILGNVPLLSVIDFNLV